MHSPGIQYCNTLCIRARIIVDGRGTAIETLPGLYLNKLVGRYEYLLCAALCSRIVEQAEVPKARERRREKRTENAGRCSLAVIVGECGSKFRVIMRTVTRKQV